MKTKSVFCVTRLLRLLLAVGMLVVILIPSATCEEVFKLPSSLTTIGKRAFSGLSGVERVMLPEGVREIDAQAFANSSIKEINLPASLTFIAEDAFEGCELHRVTAVEDSYAYAWALSQGYISDALHRALLIGENDYDSLSQLLGCLNDMNAMAGTLRGLGDAYTPSIMPNVGSADIVHAISALDTGRSDLDTFVFYYSGHGVVQGLVGTDGSVLPYSLLASLLNGIRGRVVVILDCCNSGASIAKTPTAGTVDNESIVGAAISAFAAYGKAEEVRGAVKAGELVSPKFVVLAAAHSSESSYDGLYDGSNYMQGAFTAALVKGMGCTYPDGNYSGVMPADTNRDMQITLSEIYKYVSKTASAWRPQTAQYYGVLTEVLFTR